MSNARVKSAPPIFDGTADTFGCDLCGGKHPRTLPPEDDGVHPDAAGTADRMDGLLLVVAVLALIAMGIVAAVAIGAARETAELEANR